MTTLLEMLHIHHHRLGGWYFYRRPRYGDIVWYAAECPKQNKIIVAKTIKDLFAHVRVFAADVPQEGNEDE